MCGNTISSVFSSKRFHAVAGNPLVQGGLIKFREASKLREGNPSLGHHGVDGMHRKTRVFPHF